MATAVEVRELIASLPKSYPYLKKNYIYGLTEPDSDEIRYIGKSVDPAARFSAHMNDKSNCHRVHWLNEIKRDGKTPGFVLLSATEGEWPWQEDERFWIAYGLRNGWRLTNNTSGGDGVPDLPLETRVRMGNTWRGRKHKSETLSKMSAARKGKKATMATRAKMSATQTGRKITWIGKIAEANRKLTESDLVDIRTRLSRGDKVCLLAKDYGVHRTTMSKVKMGTYLCQK